jgi:4-amino-4-deoxy-L-arabinose transferase-like glycosyltransferase
VIYSLGKKMFSTRAGLLSASFMALLAFHIDHSQQARMYTFFVFFYACTLWALVSAAREGQRWHWITYVIAGSLLAYTQGIGILYVAMIAALFPLISPKPLQVSRWAPFLLANIAVVITYVPWLMILRESGFRVGFLNWLAPPTWRSIFITLFAFVCNYIPFDTIPHLQRGIRLQRVVTIAIVVAPIVALFVMGIRRTLSNSKWWAGATAVSAFALPFVSVYLLSVFVTPIYIDRVLIPSTVGLVLVVGASLQERSKTTPLLNFLIVAGLLFSGLNTYYFFRFNDREAFRTLSEDLQRSIGADESILFISDSGLPQFLIEYYDPESTLAGFQKLDIQSILGPCKTTVDGCLNARSEGLKSDRLWIVYAHYRSIRSREAVEEWLRTHFTTVSSKGYNSSLRLSEMRAIGF